MKIGRNLVLRQFLSMAMACSLWGKGGPVPEDWVYDDTGRSVLVDKDPIMKGPKISSRLIPAPKTQMLRHDGLLLPTFSILLRDSVFPSMGNICEQSHGVPMGPEEGGVKALAKKMRSR